MNINRLKKVSVEEYLKEYIGAVYSEDNLTFGLEYYMNNFNFEGELLTGEQISEYNMNMSASFTYYPLEEADYVFDEHLDNGLIDLVVVDELIWEIPIEKVYKPLEFKKTDLTLRELRKSRGLNIAQASKLIGVSISLISKLERGQTSLSKKKAKLIGDFYGVELEPRKMVASFEVYKPVAGEREKVLMAVRKENEILKARVLTLEDKLEKIKAVLAV